MFDRDYRCHDGLALAALIRSGDVSREEVFEVACETIERDNPNLGAVVRTRYEKARREGAVVDPASPFAGVPFLTKDLLMAIGGEPLAFGSAALKAWCPAEDSSLVRRFRQAGLVILGQTATPELGLMAITEPKAFVKPRNPWAFDRSPGGSSGGAAAAVAAGLVPLAGAGDGGGSIRIPASHCGLFGFKPSRGRVPLGPMNAEVWEGAVIEHAVTRSVRDSAALFDVTNGMDEGAPLPLAQEQGFLAALERPPTGLRIAVSLGTPLGEPLGTRLHPEVRLAVEQAAQGAEFLGHHVEWCDPPVDGERLAQSFLTIYLGYAAANLQWISEQTKVPVSRLDIEPATRAIGRLGRRLKACDYVLAKRYWNTVARAMGRFHRRFDLLLMPVLADPPPRIGELYPTRFHERLMSLLAIPGLPDVALKAGLLEHLARDALRHSPFTQLANLTGQPAMSLPLHVTADGLPVGVQCLGAMGDDRRLLQFAAQIEAAMPWAERLPLSIRR
ncbi:6-aminohexanoate-cyclic-dimer hydrolase [Litchfieldella qijiaojingensis]|uniref:6-aminohexanoate-cyclic-dimer hydrolase n=1 Tax=Litchfieldella qijiaojingensis TaxID=980347 RepID=A0ABQ2YKS3_9GAMM|nr:amidase family protein [Halomonas qijiaojingensis]GGX87527.1 6-aminohexanoate-cyclic-dimer hydrolase [Halomonas qijiaojingensis]